MKVQLTRPWKNHPAGLVLDVSDGVHDDLARAGVIGMPEKLAPVAPAPTIKGLRRPPRHKMVESPDGDK